MRRGLVLCLGLAFAAAPAGADEKKAVPEKVKQHLGDQVVSMLQGASRVEVFRVDPDAGKKGDQMIGGYTITATGKEQGQEFAQKLAAVLLNDKTYFGQQARCYLPGLAFRLWNDKDEVEVVICFSCENLRLVAKDAKGQEVKKVSGAFGPEIGPLLKLAKEALPDDKEIQDIKEKGK